MEERIHISKLFSDFIVGLNSCFRTGEGHICMVKKDKKQWINCKEFNLVSLKFMTFTLKRFYKDKKQTLYKLAVNFA